MKRIIDAISKNREVFVTLLFTVGIVVFLFFKKRYIQKNGIITVAKIIKWESAEQGSDLFIDIYFKGKKYPTILGIGNSTNVGDFYFIKINKDDPSDYPILYEYQKVPDCIIKSVTYFNGWDSIPTCENFSARRENK